MPLFLHFISSMPGCWLLPTLLLHQLLFYPSDFPVSWHRSLRYQSDGDFPGYNYVQNWLLLYLWYLNCLRHSGSSGGYNPILPDPLIHESYNEPRFFNAKLHLPVFLRYGLNMVHHRGSMKNNSRNHTSGSLTFSGLSECCCLSTGLHPEYS